MKFIGVLLSLLLIVTTIGCQSMVVVYPEVDYDYNITTDFSNIKTFDWHPTSGGVKIDQLNMVRIKDTVDTQLKAKGVEHSTVAPDLLVVMYGGTTKEYTTRWRGWDDDLWYEEGRIKLAFFDPQSNKVVWWGETRADVFFYMEPEEKNKLIEQAVTRILSKYPPAKTE